MRKYCIHKQIKDILIIFKICEQLFTKHKCNLTVCIHIACIHCDMTPALLDLVGTIYMQGESKLK